MLAEKDMASLGEGLAEHKAQMVPRLEKVFYERSKSLTKLGANIKLFSNVRGIDFILKQGINRG